VLHCCTTLDLAGSFSFPLSVLSDAMGKTLGGMFAYRVLFPSGFVKLLIGMICWSFSLSAKPLGKYSWQSLEWGKFVFLPVDRRIFPWPELGVGKRESGRGKPRLVLHLMYRPFFGGATLAAHLPGK
jgi:hypothetical protein